MRRSTFFFVTLAALGIGAIPTGAGASAPEPPTETTVLSRIPCSQQVLDALDAWETPTSWRGQAPGPGEIRALSSPTGVIGTWIHLSIRETETRLTRTTPSASLQIAFAQPGCVPAIKAHPAAAAGAGQDVFSDQDLLNLLRKPGRGARRGVIYVWSPNMNYSVRGAGEALRTAGKMGWELTLLLDPHSDPDLARQVADRSGLPHAALRRLESAELINRGALVHFPFAFLYSGGKLLDRIRPGYDPPERFRRFAQEAFEALPGAAP